MSIARLAQRLKKASFDRPSLTMSAQIPGTPFSVKHDVREERLPGMRRWVDRDLLEAAMDAQAHGVPPETFVEDAGSEGISPRVLFGAGLGGFSGHHLASSNPENSVVKSLARSTGNAPLTGALIGTLIGGGAGLGYHHMTADRRRREAQEAYLGAAQDAHKTPRLSALPQERQGQGSASAVTPKLLHTAPSLI